MKKREKKKFESSIQKLVLVNETLLKPGKNKLCGKNRQQKQFYTETNGVYPLKEDRANTKRID